jgi:iron complex outermembrane recepter protein
MNCKVQLWCSALLLASVSAEEKPRVLSTLVVEASRDSILPDHFAGNATVIEEETITRAGVRSLADLLATQGGLRITSSTGNAADGELHLRGFGENSASRVLILVDGRPVNRPDMVAVSLLEVPLSRIKRVEILRGSQTARFGDHAVGGVINLVTDSPGKPKTALEIAAGSQDYSLVRLAHEGGYAGNGIAVDVERSFSAGWRKNSASELESYGLRWEREITKNAEVHAGASWAHQFTGLPGPLSTTEYRQDPQQSLYAQSGQADQYFSEQTLQRADAGLIVGKSEAVSVESPLSFSRRDLSWNLGPGSHSDTLLDTWTFAPVMRWTGEKAVLSLGVNARQDRLGLEQFAEIQRFQRTGSAELERASVGVFSTVEWEPWKDWHLSAATRWEKTVVDAAARSVTFPSDPDLNFSRGTDEINRALQLGLRWEPSDAWSTWLRYDRLYRLPSTDEIAAYQGFPLSVPFNDQLRAETGDNFELGVECEAARWSWRANGFIQQLEGEIAYDFVRNLNVNFSKTRRFGIENELRYEAERWEMSLRYTRLDATYQDGAYEGNSIYLVPNHELVAIVTLKPSSTVTVQVEYQFTGASFEGNDFLNQADKLPAYGVASLLLRYQARTDLSIYLRVNNLLDEAYATIKYSGVWFPAAGRTFQCGVRYEF